MLILGVTSPEGRKYHVAAAFPSACGKTNFAMLMPPQGFEGWKVTTIGDDIAWIKPAADGRCTRSTPRPATSASRRAPTTRPTPTAWPRWKKRRHLHQRRADRRRRRLVGGHDRRAAGAPDRLAGQGLDARDRQGQPARQAAPRRAPERALHRRRHQQPGARPEWDDPAGVPIDAFIFGGRRSTTVPLVTEARNWTEGVYMAATMGSETTAAGRRSGIVRRDPFAMLPFCRLQHERLLPATGSTWGKLGRRRRQAAAHLLRQLVPQGRRRQVRLARLRREHARAEWMLGRIDGRPAAGQSSASARATPTCAGTAWPSHASSSTSVIGIDQAAWTQELSCTWRHRGFPAPLRGIEREGALLPINRWIRRENPMFASRSVTPAPLFAAQLQHFFPDRILLHGRLTHNVLSCLDACAFPVPWNECWL
jgi:phosphoenolpyruvate carboxykinase (GTP)